ncbi:MAG: CCA tRNA nucleotidyltransferase [Patescibacteria group bacterium]
MKIRIPIDIIKISRKLEENGFESFLVGGCVRDLLSNKSPKDWDITTNAKPEDILKIFPFGKYQNEFGTVVLPDKYFTEKNKGKAGNLYEITTYRKEGKYTDKRRPDEVVFAEKVEDDLKRRDFTINAMAIRFLDVEKLWKRVGESSVDTAVQLTEYTIKDIFGGKIDLDSKLIRTVGDPYDRIEEDALRMMRAVRFAVQLDFELAVSTYEAIKKKADNLRFISKERIQEELTKIFLSPRPAKGVDLLVETNLMNCIIPEVIEAVGVRQNRHHYYGPYNTVYKHMLASLEKCPSEKLEVRLAAFLHDVGKPQTKRGEGINSTFYGHEYVGARKAREILERLKFPRKVVEKTVLLIKNHMFYYNVDEVGESGVRRVIKKVGLENINDLIDVRIADRLGSGVPKAVPYKLRHFKFMVEKVSKDAVSVKQLNINGDDLIKEVKVKPGPKIGAILEILLAEVIDNPQLNNRRQLLERARELAKKELKSLRSQSKKKIKEERKREEEEIKGKYYVK